MAAGGNPLFVEEMVAMARGPGGEIVVPPTIQALLAARLDQLEPAERDVLERGAVEGLVFHRGAVAALAPEESRVDGRLTTLVRKDLVRPEQPVIADDEAFRFRHLLIRDTAYEALPKAVRADLHERFATWLEEHGAGSSSWTSSSATTSSAPTCTASSSAHSTTRRPTSRRVVANGFCRAPSAPGSAAIWAPPGDCSGGRWSFSRQMIGRAGSPSSTSQWSSPSSASSSVPS